MLWILNRKTKRALLSLAIFHCFLLLSVLVCIERWRSSEGMENVCRKKLKPGLCRWPIFYFISFLSFLVRIPGLSLKEWVCACHASETNWKTETFLGIIPFIHSSKLVYFSLMVYEPGLELNWGHFRIQKRWNWWWKHSLVYSLEWLNFTGILQVINFDTPGKIHLELIPWPLSDYLLLKIEKSAEQAGY